MTETEASDANPLLPEIKIALRLIAPARAEALISYLEDRRARRQARLESLAEAAEAQGGETFDVLLEKARQDDSRSDLTEEVLQQATETAAEWKMRALGRALARGLLADDEAEIDEVHLMLAAIDDLEAPHVRVLQRLYAEGDRYSGIADYQLATMFPNGVRVLYALLKTLERHGLAGQLPSRVIDGGDAAGVGPDTPQMWAIWDFGILLTEQLLREGERDSRRESSCPNPTWRSSSAVR
jgi:hypothetical protein